MATRKSSKSGEAISKKEKSTQATLKSSGRSSGKQPPKNTSLKKRNSSRKAPTEDRRFPNIDAATKVVTLSVAARIDELEKTQPQAKVAAPKILAEKGKRKARASAPRQRKIQPTDSKNKKQETRSSAKKTTTKHRSQRNQNLADRAESQPTPTATSSRKTQKRSSAAKKVAHQIRVKTEETSAEKAAKKTTSRKSQQRSTTARKVSRESRTKTEPVKADSAAKKTTTKASRKTRHKTASKSKDSVQKASEQTKTKPRVKRRSRKTRSNTAVPIASHPEVGVVSDEYVIGFQGIYYKPYQLATKDLFMSGAQQDHFMDILVRAKEKLLLEEADRASQLQENDASNLPDPLDQGTNEGVFHNQLRTRDRESQLVRKINRAIDCLKTGSYGYCEACGCEIPLRRLEARPIVTKCIDCKERDELRERQLGQ